ncbi:glycosyltransferase [Azospirillum sp. TSO22-1]|uniref:glycosyltransferase n=1 Tax=Azospirillum sp. TSO22-1 TaxID=716789 RepID=UPI0011B6C204|nr:glycosyltransferase [Azospirillum sp. TSO22-1]
MRDVYADIRALQAAALKDGPAARHLAAVLCEARRRLPDGARLTGLADPALPDLDAAALVDRLLPWGALPAAPRGAVLLQSLVPGLAPMPHVRTLGGWVLRAALLHALPDGAGDRLERIEALAWAPHHDRILATGPDVAGRMTAAFGVLRERIAVTGLAPDEPTAAERVWTALAAAWEERFAADPAPAAAARSASWPARPRIAVVASWPPAPSGVAARTAAQVGALGRHADIDVYTPGLTPDRPARPTDGVRALLPLSALPYLSDRYDRVLTVLGGAEGGAGGGELAIFDLALRFGGAVLLHGHQLVDHSVAQRGAEAVARVLGRRIGREIPAGELRHRQRLKDELPDAMLDETLAVARPLIVSSRDLHRRLRERGEDVRWIPACPTRRFADADLGPEARAAARRRLGLPEDRLQLAAFGAVAESRGSDGAIWTLRSLLAWGVPADLTFVGPPGAVGPALRRLVARLGLEERCRFMDGWADDAVYDDWLRAADVALQLRTYGEGVVSGSLLDCIAAGLPTITTEAQARAADAPGFCARLGDRLSPVLAAEAVLALVEGGRHRAPRASPDRDAYLERHGAEACGAALFEALAPAPVPVLGAVE